MWRPTRFERLERRLRSRMSPAQVVTDAGPAYLKCLGSGASAHCLACEWIGTRVAGLLGLPTFEVALLELSPDDVPFDETGCERPGPAFAARSELGMPWDRSSRTLARLSNPDDLSRLIVADTLLANWDRLGPQREPNLDNVFLSRARVPGELTLLAMDFSHCLVRNRHLGPGLDAPARVRDEALYGFCEAFAPYLTPENVAAALKGLARLTDEKIGGVVEEVPDAWEMDGAIRSRIRTFLMRRRDYLLESLYARISLLAGCQTRCMREEEA